VVQGDFRHSGVERHSYTSAQLWFPIEEARDLVRVLQLAIATTAEYQDAQEKAALQDAAMAPQKEG
jgi:hypothetical protein